VLVAICLSFHTVSAEAQTLQVTSPNGGESWTPGSVHQITWTSSNLSPSGTLYIFYSYGGGWQQVANLPPSAVSYNWTVPNTPITSTTVWVGNWVNGAWQVSDQSNQPFMIATGGLLSFPLPASLYPQGPYTAGKNNTVLDHHMSAVYTDLDSSILSFTGELFQATKLYPSTIPQACYPKAGNAAWSALLSTMYKGTGKGQVAPYDCSTNIALNYEAHPGYDYVATTGTPVLAAARGHVVTLNGGCVPKGLSEGCAQWGAVGIDHENGYITQYLHLSKVLVSPGDLISEGQQIGFSGNMSPVTKPVGPHLHFEVLRLRSGTLDNYAPGSYATVDPYGFDASKGYTDYMTSFNDNLPNICLWKSGCRYQ